MDFLSWWGSPAGQTLTWLVVVDFVIRVVALGTVPHNRRPSSALAWLALIFFFPIAGLVIFLLFGRLRLRGSRAAFEHRLADELRRNDDHPARKEAEPDVRLARIPPAVSAAVTLNRNNGATPLTAGNELTLHTAYDESLEAMTRCVKQAVSFVHVQFYIVAADSTTDCFFAALVEAHARGVQVRVLLDHLGSKGFPGYRAATSRLDAAGISWRKMLPVAPPRFQYQRPDLRNHRKIVVVDNRVGFTGSQNIIDASYNKKRNRRKNFEWIDLMVEVEGPTVPQLNTVFLADWSAETHETETREDIEVQAAAPSTGPVRNALGSQLLPSYSQLIPSGPGLGNSNNLRLFNHLIYGAEQRVVICSPYLVPDESLLIALTSAAQRGIDVDVHLGATSDHVLTHHAQRSYYEELLRAGVNIHLYRQPFVLHSKFVIIDSYTSVIASSNMDVRSFELNQEISLLVLDRRIVGELGELAARYAGESSTLDLSSWRERPAHQKFLDNACRLTANLQ
ncbi:cardiolipin synthase [Arthrobacter sp. Soil782]|uniref:cardiolipin synthase n=1 Tax=Arthrobacter sp. Soil782 TaxID=1736410 RepID=UPI000A7B36E2|nr:cardiolipin synthase [Arthrobacter sp. Soil782]